MRSQTETGDRVNRVVSFPVTLKKVLSRHVVLMRFRVLLNSDGRLFLQVLTVPLTWFDWLYQRQVQHGYDASAYLYFFTSHRLSMTVRRAGYAMVQVVAHGLRQQRWLHSFHNLLPPLTPTAIVIARPRPEFVHPAARALRFLPAWAAD